MSLASRFSGATQFLRRIVCPFGSVPRASRQLSQRELERAIRKNGMSWLADPESEIAIQGYNSKANPGKASDIS